MEVQEVRWSVENLGVQQYYASVFPINGWFVLVKALINSLKSSKLIETINGCKAIANHPCYFDDIKPTHGKFRDGSYYCFTVT